MWHVPISTNGSGGPIKRAAGDRKPETRLDWAGLGWTGLGWRVDGGADTGWAECPFADGPLTSLRSTGWRAPEG